MAVLVLVGVSRVVVVSSLVVGSTVSLGVEVCCAVVSIVSEC